MDGICVFGWHFSGICVFFGWYLCRGGMVLLGLTTTQCLYISQKYFLGPYYDLDVSRNLYVQKYIVYPNIEKYVWGLNQAHTLSSLKGRNVGVYVNIIYWLALPNTRSQVDQYPVFTTKCNDIFTNIICSHIYIFIVFRQPLQ